MKYTIDHFDYLMFYLSKNILIFYININMKNTNLSKYGYLIKI